MDYEDLIRYFGSCAAAGRALRMSPQTVWCWKRRGIPLYTQYYIEACTGGALLAPPIPTQHWVRQQQRLAQAARRAEFEQNATATQQTTTVTRRLSRR
jgi:hypothetical protein